MPQTNQGPHCLPGKQTYGTHIKKPRGGILRHPSKEIKRNGQNTKTQLQTDHGIKEDQQVYMIVAVDTSKHPRELSLSTYLKTKQWILSTTIPHNNSKPSQTRKLSPLTTNQIDQLTGGDGKETPPTTFHHQVSTMARGIGTLPTEITVLFQKITRCRY